MAFGPDKQSEYLEWLAKGLRRTAAAEATGVSRNTVALLRKADKEFAEAEDDAEANASEPLENKLYELALDGNMHAIMYWLGNRTKGRWRDTRRPDRQTFVVEQTHTLEAGASIERIALLVATLEERAALKEGRELPVAIDDAEIVSDGSNDAI